MDIGECQGCCHGNLQNGDDNDKEHKLPPQPLCCKDNLHKQSKSPITTENLQKLGCHGNCCDPAVSTPDTEAKQTNEINGVETSSDTCTTHRTQSNSLSLATLPPELILVIFSYLDARFTLRVLTCVCRLFCNLLSPESSWKTRFGKRWPQRDKREDYDYVSRSVYF